MRIIESKTRKLIPAPGLHLRNIITGDVFEGEIYMAKSQTIDDFEEITQEEYERIIGEQEAEQEAEGGE